MYRPPSTTPQRPGYPKLRPLALPCLDNAGQKIDNPRRRSPAWAAPSSAGLTKIRKMTLCTPHLHREADRIGLVDRPPRQDLGNVVERHAEQSFELLSRRERTPFGMGETSSRVAEIWEGNDAAFLKADAEPALSLESGASHSPRMWQVPTLRQVPLPACACNGGAPPPDSEHPKRGQGTLARACEGSALSRGGAHHA